MDRYITGIEATFATARKGDLVRRPTGLEVGVVEECDDEWLRIAWQGGVVWRAKRDMSKVSISAGVPR